MLKLTCLISFFILLPFQACNNKHNFSSLGDGLKKSEMNGEGYGGKPTPFDFVDLNLRCPDIGANGQPLPNSQIFTFSSGAVQLVRENCTDIQPRFLRSSEYSFNSEGNIVFQNRIFILNQSQTPFDIVAASCPAGKSLLASAVRTSLVREPLDLQAVMWEHAGLTVTMEGSLASLPIYKVQRSDPTALESWHRMAQSAMMTAGESYVYSFYVKPEATEKMMFTSYYSGVQDFRIEFDLATGAAAVQSSIGVTLLSTKAQTFAGGLYINIYFQPQSDVHANIGIASSGEFLGSSVFTTALQLEKISNFCSP